MGKSEIVMRLLSAETRIKLADMRSGRLNDDDWVTMARRMGEIDGAPLFIDDSPNLTMMEIRAKARRLKQKTDLRLMVVDYLQLMSSGKKRRIPPGGSGAVLPPTQTIGQGTRRAGGRGQPAQPRPEQRTDKTPQLADLRESGRWSRTPTWSSSSTGPTPTNATAREPVRPT